MAFRLISCLLIVVFFSGIALPEESSRRKLRWMGLWENRGARQQLIGEALEEFQFLYQDADIVMKFAPQITGGPSKNRAAEYIVKMIQTGQIDWDVVWMDSKIYRLVAEELDDPHWGKKHLVDFSEYPDIEAAHRPNLVAGPLRHQKTAGIFVGPYIEGFYNYLWYNEAVAKQVGLEIQDHDMSAETFLNYCSKIKEYNQKAATPVIPLTTYKNPAPIRRLAYNLYLSEHLAHPEIPDKEVFSKILRFFEKIYSLNPSLYKNQSSRPWSKAVDLLNQNQALFFVAPSWCLNKFESVCPELVQRLCPAQLPGFEKQSFYTGAFIPAWAVMKNSPNRDLGIALMRFWCTPAMAQKWGHYTQSPTGLSEKFYETEYGLGRFSQFNQQLAAERTLVRDVVFLQKEQRPIQPIWDDLVLIMDGEVTADEAIAKLEENTGRE